MSPSKFKYWFKLYIFCTALLMLTECTSAAWALAGPLQSASELLKAMRLDSRSGSVLQDARRHGQQQGRQGSAPMRYVQHHPITLVPSAHHACVRLSCLQHWVVMPAASDCYACNAQSLYVSSLRSTYRRQLHDLCSYGKSCILRHRSR